MRASSSAVSIRALLELDFGALYRDDPGDCDVIAAAGEVRERLAALGMCPIDDPIVTASQYAKTT
jgi:hypothetical protein